MPAPVPPATYCNPLPIPNYPLGRGVRQVAAGDPTDGGPLWLVDRAEQYRELADPTAVWHDDTWYLYPSCDMAWVSTNQGGTWQHRPLNLRDLGYAPTVVLHKGRFLLLASGSPLFASASPLGPFVPLGNMRLPPVAGMPSLTDPMLFSDDDGRLFFYWGCSPTGGIWAVELDAADPTHAIGTPAEVIPFRPDLFPWEAVGDWNQNPNTGWIEGAWLLKHGGTYYLTYSAAGTENRTYAMGCYAAPSPLGPFTPQGRNPILRSPDGLVTGTAHGGIVAGPGGSLWAFYTVRAGAVHGFERRIGMDRARIDEHGELWVPAATSLPQWLPGREPGGDAGAETGWLPLNLGMQALGSSSAPNLPGRLAVDNDLRTWWQPAPDDRLPTLTSRLHGLATVHAVRIVWRDIGLDTTRGVTTGPFRYRIELETAPDVWTAILDRTASTEDLLIDYRECPPVSGVRVRLVVTGWPHGITPGVAEFTVFGEVAKQEV